MSRKMWIMAKCVHFTVNFAYCVQFAGVGADCTQLIGKIHCKILTFGIFYTFRKGILRNVNNVA